MKSQVTVNFSTKTWIPALFGTRGNLHRSLKLCQKMPKRYLNWSTGAVKILGVGGPKDLKS